MTDLYNVDARYGTNEDYKRLSSKAKELGIGLIMDQVANHIGSYHRWMSDLPSNDWVNQWEEFTETNHMKVSRFDPHEPRSTKSVSRRLVCTDHAGFESTSAAIGPLPHSKFNLVD